MSNGRKNITREEHSISFFSKITAMFTHDLNNIISIIDQSAGLMEDLMPKQGSSEDLPIDRFMGIIEKIKKHSARGIFSIKNLNTFSHGIDRAVAAVNINSVIRNLKELTNRLFNNKGIELKLDLMEQDYEFSNNPFMIQQIVFMVIEIVLPSVQRGQNIVLSTSPNNGSVLVALKAHLDDENPELEFNSIADISQSINAEINHKLEGSDLLVSILIHEMKPDYAEG